MRSQVVNLWNYNSVQTAAKEAQLKYAYEKHVQSLNKLNGVKKPSFDVEAPYLRKKRNVAYSKLNKERQLVIEQENGALIHKMIDVKKKDGEYSKKQLIKSIESSSAPKSLFLPLKIATERKVNSENLAMTVRLKNANSTINFKSLDKEFVQSTKYKSNITNRSRRIFNCFLLNGSQSQMSIMGKSQMSQSQLQTTRMDQRRPSQDDPFKPILDKNQIDSPPKKQKQKKNGKKISMSHNNSQTQLEPLQHKKEHEEIQTHDEEGGQNEGQKHQDIQHEGEQLNEQNAQQVQNQEQGQKYQQDHHNPEQNQQNPEVQQHQQQHQQQQN